MNPMMVNAEKRIKIIDLKASVLSRSFLSETRVLFNHSG